MENVGCDSAIKREDEGEQDAVQSGVSCVWCVGEQCVGVVWCGCGVRRAACGARCAVCGGSWCVRFVCGGVRAVLLW